MDELRVFIGYDHRQPLAYNVCRFSIERRVSKSVAVHPLRLDLMPMNRRGLTDFTFTRYLAPYLCDYKGKAVFIDPDMLVLCDINELVSLAEGDSAVSVAQNKLRFEWPSLMVFNNELCKSLTPQYIENGKPQTFDWASKVGSLPSEYNHIVPYDEPRNDAKIVHYTAGVPCWPETKNCEYAKEWLKEFDMMCGTVSWKELMGNSVHAKLALGAQ